ncbi:cytochrome c biogenesis protein CcsA [bacterium SCSIO 12643]|nr:cytochrome c biogenesis protein CcsA [bacterium SCSIO 12643]
MMKQLMGFLSSNKISLIILLIFGTACGYGTFLENDYGTPAVRAVVYDAWWFELIMGLLAVNFLLNIQKYRLYRREKWSLLFFHLGFVVVLIGAFVSRYTGFEGVVSIREGHATETMRSNKSYLTLKVDEEELVKGLEPTVLTPPKFEYTLNDVTVSSVDYIPFAEKDIVAGADYLLTVVMADQGQRATYVMKRGQVIDSPYGMIGFNANDPVDVQLRLEGDQMFIQSNVPAEVLEMATQTSGSFAADTLVPLKFASLYRAGAMSFVVKSAHPDSKIGYTSSEDKKLQRTLSDKVILNVSSEGEHKEIALDYRPTETSKSSEFKLNGKQVSVAIGPEIIPLGFSLYLKDFELIRYPGSTSPSSYSSYLDVIDGSEKFPYTIYMNNVLDHGGFRFFQASYDTDEKGTVLSVNHDWWGTQVTYLGYFLLTLGMIWSLFAKDSRFQFLSRSLAKVKKQRMTTLILLLFSLTVVGQNSGEFEKVSGVFPKEVGQAFGGLLLQDMDGRIKPVNTLASELTRKLTGKTTFNLQYDSVKTKLDVNQLFLAIHAKPQFWTFAPVIKIDQEKGRLIQEKLGSTSEFLALKDFFNAEGQYKLQDMVDEAYNTKPDQRSAHMEEVIKVDERFNILYQALTDSYMKMFPKPDDLNHGWFTDKSVLLGVGQEDSVFIRNILPMVFNASDSARMTGDLSKVHEYIGYIKKYQEHYAEDIIPSQNQIKAELWYNKMRLFFHLFYSYALVGLILLIIAITLLFKPRLILFKIQKGLVYFTAFLFVVQTANMIIRWYAGGYPPWSNGYEMTILVSWATILFGILFHKKTDFILPLATLFTGTLLFVAFLDWLNPEITNLVPVLKSYWLKIHVAIIVGSYAPLALSALLGFTSLWMMILVRKQNDAVKNALKEITLLNEMAMTIGIYMLTIGTFLGGVWANESWGRYWGWDPKETWALISILAYAIVLHLRLIPVIKPFKYWFSAASVVAFFSIIMTSFGVNYYLSGLHSYAQGDPLPIPSWVYILVSVVGVSVLLAYFAIKRKQK